MTVHDPDIIEHLLPFPGPILQRPTCVQSHNSVSVPNNSGDRHRIPREISRLFRILAPEFGVCPKIRVDAHRHIQLSPGWKPEAMWSLVQSDSQPEA
jgi:hypothetical protein